jgi:hypothetical protein
VSVVMSVTLLVPINNRVAAWTADHHPADWREQQKRWDRLHYARVAIIVAGFVLTLVAGQSPEPRSPSPFTTSQRPWGEFGVGQFERRANEGHDK